MAATFEGEAGFSLVEVLVAMAVLAVGLLGAAQTVLASVRSQGESARLATAVQLVRELAEQARLGGGGGGGAVQGAGQVGQQNWRLRVEQALPGARVAVCVDAGLPNAGVDARAWACDATGPSRVVKLGWNAHAGGATRDDPPRIVMQLPSGAAGHE